jgi:hypothetical protein
VVVVSNAVSANLPLSDTAKTIYNCQGTRGAALKLERDDVAGPPWLIAMDNVKSRSGERVYKAKQNTIWKVLEITITLPRNFPSQTDTKSKAISQSSTHGLGEAADLAMVYMRIFLPMRSLNFELHLCPLPLAISSENGEHI